MDVSVRKICQYASKRGRVIRCEESMRKETRMRQRRYLVWGQVRLTFCWTS